MRQWVSVSAQLRRYARAMPARGPGESVWVCGSDAVVSGQAASQQSPDSTYSGRSATEPSSAETHWDVQRERVGAKMWAAVAVEGQWEGVWAPEYITDRAPGLADTPRSRTGTPFGGAACGLFRLCTRRRWATDRRSWLSWCSLDGEHAALATKHK
eukprot:scaffold7233_cov570-Prasinococcus_capsulatus_cf.AAC.9